jgi:hypothetical protein
MHRAAVDQDPCRERLTMRVRAAESGEKGGMDVEHPPGPALNEPIGEDAHEAREAQDVDARRLQGAVEFLLEGAAVRKSLVVHHCRRDAGLGGAREPGGLGPVRGHEHDLGGIIRLPRRRDEGSEVGAAPRDEDAHAFAAHGGAPQARSSEPR